MSEQNKQVPRLRFPGFTDAWVKCTFEDLGIITAGGDVNKKGLLLSGNYPVLANALNNDGIIGYYDDYKVSAPAVTITGRGNIGHAKARKISYTPTVRLISLEPFNSDVDFLENLINTNNFFVESTGVPQLTGPQFGHFEVILPKREEQTKIGKFFQHLDNLITVNERELNKLKNLKKSYLEKMFPKNGSNIPELRFPGYTDAWVKYELSELAKFSKGRGYSKSDLVKAGYPIILYGRLYTNYETTISTVTDTFVSADLNSIKSEIGDVIVPGSGETAEDISRASTIDISGIILGGDLNIIKPDKQVLDSIFLAITISNGSQQRELTKRAQGKSVVHLHNSDLERILVYLPSKNEQTKIGNFFTKLDKVITVNERELKKLKELKKSYLNDMFV